MGFLNAVIIKNGASSIAVDTWRNRRCGAPPPTAAACAPPALRPPAAPADAFFLTHLHTDHLDGLSGAPSPPPRRPAAPPAAQPPQQPGNPPTRATRRLLGGGPHPLHRRHRRRPGAPLPGPADPAGSPGARTVRRAGARTPGRAAGGAALRRLRPLRVLLPRPHPLEATSARTGALPAQRPLRRQRRLPV